MHFNLLDGLRPHALEFRKRRAGSGQRRHLGFDFLALLFLALDVHIPADELAGQADILTLLADRQRQLRILDDDFKVPRFGVNDLDARDLRGAQRFLRKGDGIFGVGDDYRFFRRAIRG